MDFWEKDVPQIEEWLDELLEGDHGNEVIQRYHYVEASLRYLKQQKTKLQQESQHLEVKATQEPSSL
jgi:beta-glucanase (GH16 family)